jgi:hypothetical protein
MDLTKEEFEEWWNQRSTQEVLRKLGQERENLKNLVSFGATIGDTADQTATETARVVGKIEALSYILEKEVIEDDN